jgi:hypothetical protein
MHNEKVDKVLNNGGFSYALYLKSPNIRLKDQDIKNLKANLEMNNLSLDEKLSKQFELVNCLSDDLLNKIEVGSPMKSINNDSVNLFNLNLEEKDGDTRTEEASPSNKLDNKVVKINVKFDIEEEKQLPKFSCLINEDKPEFQYSKNNFPMKKFFENIEDSHTNFKKINNNLPFHQNLNNHDDTSINTFNNYSHDFNQNMKKHVQYNSQINNIEYHNNPRDNTTGVLFNSVFNNQDTIYNKSHNYHSSRYNFNGSNGNSNSNSANDNCYNNNYNLKSYNNINKCENSFNQKSLINTDIKKKKQFIDREGDWVCMKCKNKNFSFRVLCNRCKLHKCESENMYSQHMKNLMNLVKMNEMMQNKIFNENSPNLSNNFSNQGFLNFNPTLFSPNSCPIYDENCSDIYSINTTYNNKDSQSYH